MTSPLAGLYRQLHKPIYRFLTTWLYGIARNVYRKRMAQEQRRRRPVPAPEMPVSPAEAALEQEERLLVARALSALPDPYREVLVLREYQDLSYAEVSHLLGRTETWARVTCFRARQLLRIAYLKEEGGSGP